MRHRLLMLSLLLIPACSGGGGGGAPGTPPREPYVPIIPDENLGPTGSASYAGGVGLRFSAPSSAEQIILNGDLTLRVDFDLTDNAVTGFAAGFAAGDIAYAGTLYLSDGAIDDSSGGLDFAAQVSGALQQDRDSYLLFGTISGEFLGNTAEVATGQVLGTARQAGRDTVMSGQFQVARQP